jgi:hypothetical protein
VRNCSGLRKKGQRPVQEASVAGKGEGAVSASSSSSLVTILTDLFPNRSSFSITRLAFVI